MGSPAPQTKRIDSIDLFKGIAIAVIVWKHTYHPQCFDLISVSSLFFILSGTFIKDEPFVPFLKKKIQTILIPFLFFYLLSFGTRLVFHLAQNRTLHGFTWDSILDIFTISDHCNYLSVNIPLWFLLCLFIMQILFWILNKIVPSHKYRTGWSLLIIGVIYAGYPAIEKWHTPFMFNIAIECLPYLIVGNLFGLKIAHYLSVSTSKYILAPAAFVLFIALQYLRVDFGLLIFVESLTIFTGTLALLACFEGNRSPICNTIRTLGKASLLIMGIHALILAPLQTIVHTLSKLPHLLTGLICLILTLFIIYLLIPVVNKYIPWAVGKKK